MGCNCQMLTSVELSGGRWLRRWHPLLGVTFAVLAAGSSSPSRVVALADLHGDYDHALAILRAAGLADENSEIGVSEADELLVAEAARKPWSRFRGVQWLGGNATLVQTGDLVDRRPFARDLYALFSELRRQAPLAGGQVINLIGNHEAMNVLGQLKYVTKEDTDEFGSHAEREQAFAAGGWVGRQILEEFKALAVVAETLFVHAGLLPEHAAMGVESLDLQVRTDLAKAAASRSGGHGQPLLKSNGPLWVRQFAKGQDSKVCPLLAATLKLVGAKRMVIGHTQVDEGEIRQRCGNRLLLADTIISRQGYPECWEPDSWQRERCKGSLSYVELRGDEAYAMRALGIDAIESAPEQRLLPIEGESGEAPSGTLGKLASWLQGDWPAWTNVEL
ncbi:unnamed protein product [Polarella glacialis]|uniref:Calcineurin-like phosphoesterase domain-containing protein n=1 Tax=Polarella glacialis TaxID=89957 RepID=A0A813KSY0_POLGL|nr:unnamed protein product [Polarella glacialis]